MCYRIMLLVGLLPLSACGNSCAPAETTPGGEPVREQRAEGPAYPSSAIAHLDPDRREEVLHQYEVSGTRARLALAGVDEPAGDAVPSREEVSSTCATRFRRADGDVTVDLYYFEAEDALIDAIGVLRAGAAPAPGNVLVGQNGAFLFKVTTRGDGTETTNEIASTLAGEE